MPTPPLPNPPPDPLVVRIARENRNALLAREDLQLQRMARQWLALENSLQREMLALAEQIAMRPAGTSVTEQLIRELDRYKVLNQQLKQRVLEYASTQATADITAEQLAYAETGLAGSVAAIKSQFLMGVNFNTLSVDAFENMAGLLGDGTPLNRLLKEAYPDALDGIVKAMLEGFAKGLGPLQIAQNMANGMGQGLDRLTLIARTEQLRIWRIASQQQYLQSGVVLYHVRLSARDARTCMACLALDGEKIPVDTVLDDHPRGRCTSFPVVKGAPPVVWEHGDVWFLRQPPEVQREMMGTGMYNLWKEKNFKIRDIATKVYDPVWGASPKVRTLQEMKLRT